MFKNERLPMDLQLFAEPTPAADPATVPPQTAQPTAGSQQTQQTAAPQFDYEKLASMVAGKQTVTEETVLKGYFKQQGLTKEQMDEAIATFKQQQAANQPDVNALQTQATQAQALAQQAQVENKAILEAIQLGIDPKTVPYVLKLADLSQVMDAEGNINQESIQNALKKVLEDVPALKPEPKQATGFVQVGASGGQQQSTQNDQLSAIFGNKK
ncbi:hypothetical protein [Ruminococcus gauvreauii]|uniref:hypothetical protein n=1 Tax=Ruminococcus gauvreauii TaxID=438033 RepID=UPI003983F462